MKNPDDLYEIIDDPFDVQKSLSSKGRPKIQSIREYQDEIFVKSLNMNSIIYLETGTGKTLVSAMLIYYYLKKFQCKRNQKKIFFLANTTQLVY